ncbi:MAG: TonB-dependent receptor [Halioglobus sp.]
MARSKVNTAIHRNAASLLAIAICYAISAAFAQAGTLEEVIVTANKRAQNLQDVPITVTAFSEEIIQEAGIKNVSDLALLTPSLNISVNTQPFTAAFRIRGIGTSQSDPALEPSVGLFVDDVYLSRSGLGMSDLTDIERIEVLQGPQGTLYGKNTNAGAISIFTKRPNLEEFEGYLESTVGDYDLRMVTVAASGPITPALAYRLSGNINERDGYFINSSGDDLNSANDWNIVGKLLYEPSDDLSILITGNYVDRDSKCCAADASQGASVNEELVARGLPPDKNNPYDHKIAVNVDNDFYVKTRSLSMVIDYDRDWGALKSITALGDSDGGTSYDVDRSELDVMSYIDAVSSGDSYSQEFRFTSEAGSSLDYLLGVFYFQSTNKVGDDNPFVFLGEDFISQANQQPDLGQILPPGVPNIAFIAQPGDSLRVKDKLETQTVAVFGQSTWHISERWRLTGGLRWTDESKDADLFTAVDSTAISAALTGQSFLTAVSTPIDDDFSRNNSDVNWLVNVSYDVLDETMLFASAATGTKSGGFNTVNGTPQQREFEDESTISYEMGAKSTLLDARLRINASAFLTQIDDFQFQQQLATGIGTLVSNQASVETSGLDLDVQAVPLPNLTLGAGLMYLYKYRITAGAQQGDDLPFAAQYSGNVSATVFFPLADGGVYLRTDFSYMGDHLTTASADYQDRDVQDRKQLNANLGWRNDHWNVSVWGKNLTDEKYAGLTAATFPVTSMDAYFLTPPRTYGATLRYTF